MKYSIIIFAFLWSVGFSQTIPTSSDPAIQSLINKIGVEKLESGKGPKTKEEAIIYRQLGKAFNAKGQYEEADWYLEKVRGFVEVIELEPEVVFEMPKQVEPEKISEEDIKSLEADKKFLENLPTTYDNVSPKDMTNLAAKIEGQIQKLIKEKEELLKRNAPKEVITAKEATIGSLDKEKEIIDLSIDKSKLKKETKVLGLEKENLRKYLKWAIIAGVILILAIFVLIQRKTIRVQDLELDKQLDDIITKNKYLEHAARLIRHDMHSGINTYMPRGITSLEKRLSVDEIKNLKIDGSLKMIKEGLAHTQKVYKNVYEFTNLVKYKNSFDTEDLDITQLLNNYFEKTSYYDKLSISQIGELKVNPILFCNAIENFVKNGLKYNNSEFKKIIIDIEDGFLTIQDNGIGMDSAEFKSHITNKTQTEGELGLGLNISIAILKEHGFQVDCEKNEIGTKIKIKYKND